MTQPFTEKVILFYVLFKISGMHIKCSLLKKHFSKYQSPPPDVLPGQRIKCLLLAQSGPITDLF